MELQIGIHSEHLKLYKQGKKNFIASRIKIPLQVFEIMQKQDKLKQLLDISETTYTLITKSGLETSCYITLFERLAMKLNNAYKENHFDDVTIPVTFGHGVGFTAKCNIYKIDEEMEKDLKKYKNKSDKKFLEVILPYVCGNGTYSIADIANISAVVFNKYRKFIK